MQILIKTIAIFLTIFLSIVIFMPKKNFYYLLEKELLKSNITISQEQIRDNLLTLNLSNGNLYYQDSKGAFFENIKISPFLFFNSIDIKTLQPDKSFENIIPVKLNRAKISYNLFSFSKVDIKIEGNFGIAEGFFDISKNTIKLYVAPNQNDSSFEIIKKFIKNTKEGFIYEKTF